MPSGTEQDRLAEAHGAQVPWKRWGPYLSERQWGTVREDYSADGNAWAYFRTIKRARAPIAGVKTASRDSPTRSSACASASRSGTARIRSSKNASSA